MCKVCHLTSVHPIDDVRIYVKECISLANSGFDVTLIAFGSTPGIQMEDGVRRISLSVPIRGRIQRLFKRSFALYRQARLVNADLYHFHDPELIPFGLVLKMKGKVVVYDVHEDVPRQILHKSWIPLGFKKVVSKLFEIIENYSVKKFDAVVTVTEHIANRFTKIAKNLAVCHNYASLLEFESLAINYSNRTNICYIGGLTKIRGIVEVTAAARMAEVQIELAGSFESSTLEKEVINSFVSFHGYANRDTVKLIASRCFAGMVTFLPVPNHVEACPNKIFEYMAMGMPVIASNFEPWKRIIEDNSLGICVDPMDVEGISSAILRLKNNPDLVQVCGQNGRKAFLEKYNWQVEEKKLISLYSKLLQK